MFEIFTSAFDFGRLRSLAARNPCWIEDAPSLFKQGWDDSAGVQSWQNTLDWEVNRCGFCAGCGLQGFKINHSLGKCRQRGARQRPICVGEAIFAEGIKTQGSCKRYSVPQEFCNG